MQIGNLTFRYPLWKKASFVILMVLTFLVHYYGKVLTLDRYESEIKLAEELSEEYKERTKGLPFSYEPNPGALLLSDVSERLEADPNWKFAMFIRWFWVAFMVFAFPYIRTKTDECQKT